MAKKKTGRPEKTWTEKDIITFKALCAQFNTELDICAIMGVNTDTLVKNINKYLYEDITGHKRRGTAVKVSFSDAFKKYSANGRVSLRRRQYQKAMEEGNVPLLIFLGKQYLGQSDNPNGGAEKDDGDIKGWIDALGLK